MPKGNNNGDKSTSRNSSTIVTLLLDRTGSMASCKDATIEAFNAYLRTLKEAKSEIEFTFLQFDSMSLDKMCVSAAPKDVAELTHETFQPRASTPLVDAAYKTITAVDRALKARTDTPKIVICIQTDGYENASVEYTMNDLNALIKEKSAQGWQFNFMGAGIDAYLQGAQMGIAAQSTVSYDKASGLRTRRAFGALAANTVRFSTGRMADTAFSLSQKTASGDVYQGKPLPAVPPNPQPKPGEAVKTRIVDDITL